MRRAQSAAEADAKKAASGAGDLAKLRSDLAAANKAKTDAESRARAAAAYERDLSKLQATHDATRGDLAKRDARIKELEAQLRAKPKAAPKPAPKPAAKAKPKPKVAAKSTAPPVASLADLDKGAWRSGTTKLGISGANHSDDLKKINGIGPVMEKLLNSYGVKSWEQLASLTKKEVNTLDEALEDFPGRIERDEWVPQARAFIKNGHKPVDHEPKARPKPAAKPAVKKDKSGRTLIGKNWSKGKTKLGTPGAGHKDDLKVVNGIGPKMEGILNGFGITTWEQLAAFSKADVEKVNDAIETFPGRIERDEWVPQAKDLVKRFPLTKPYHRPDRTTYLNNSDDDNPWE